MKQLIAISELIQAAGLGVQGQDLFVATMPGDVVRGVMLRPPLAPTDLDDGMDGFVDETILVIVRDPDAYVGYEKAEAIAKVLTGRHVQVGNVTFAWMRPESLPVSFPRGDGDEVETSVRIQIGWAITA